MRLLVYPHDLQIGGSQINAIDLAAAAAEAGHEVHVYGIPGPLVDLVDQRGLHFAPAHALRNRPAPTRVAQLASLARTLRLDLIHSYEWPPCLDAWLGAGLVHGVPVLCSVLSMALSPLVPRSVPLVMGTLDLAQQARLRHGAEVWALEPPIDVVGDHPGIDGSGLRQQLGVGNHELLVVGVSRLAIDLKLDALVRAIDAADLLGSRYPLRLVLVGTGEAHSALATRAGQVNQRHQREVVTLLGPLLDPRPAYAAADVVVAMGSSALRAMAMGRAVVVQGEAGFSAVFDRSTLPLFLRQGFYGVSDDAPGAARLAAQLAELLGDAGRRAELGRLGRRVVDERFSLTRAAGILQGIYQQVLTRSTKPRAHDALVCLAGAIKLEIDNHNPWQTRRHSLYKRSLLAAASEGLWPPPACRPSSS